MLHRIRFWLAGALGCATALGGGLALAVDEPANIIKYREAIMSANAGHLSALAGMAKGEVSFTDEAAFHAQALNEQNQNLARLFPEGSGRGDTEEDSRALPAIWENPDEFQQAIERFQEETAALAELTSGGDFEQAAFAQQVAQVGREGCGGCHDDFREED